MRATLAYITLAVAFSARTARAAPAAQQQQAFTLSPSGSLTNTTTTPATPDDIHSPAPDGDWDPEEEAEQEEEDDDELDDVYPEYDLDDGGPIVIDEKELLRLASADPPGAKRKLKGRFLHITDIHPDPFYRPGKGVNHACHRGKANVKKGKTKSGFWGTAFEECDSPLRLTNFTLDYLAKNWADEIDFVVWTGDNARHDNDRRHPRTTKEIYQLNRAVAKKMWDIFGSRGIPAVPSLGNNDVWPHNIMTPGPNSITNEFSSIWKAFVPFSSFQIFQRGAYYSVEVIPQSLAVIALNTMYFYDSNKAVGGCDFKEPDDPGNLQLDWLDVQLQTFRERGIQVYVTGHVPPSPGNYFPECYVRYTELALRYQDTIVGHLFGHMNADHFRFLEADDLDLPEGPTEPQTSVRTELYASLIGDFEDLPKRKNIDERDYAVVNVAPAVVPNPYTPAFRIFSYNVTGARSMGVVGSSSRGEREGDPETRGKDRKHGHHRGGKGDKQSGCKKGQPWADTWRCHLDKKWHSDPAAPSRTNTLWSPLGYAQYYIPKLEAANKTRKPKFKLEYTTLAIDRLHPSARSGSAVAGGHSDDVIDADDGAIGAFAYPFPLKLLPKSLRNATRTSSKFAPYKMVDLTVGSWTRLANQLGRQERRKLRKKFREYMYFGGEEGK